MAADKPTAVNGTASNGDYNTADIAMLTTLLAQQTSDTDAESVSMSDVDIAEELRRIEAAHGLAEGMEDRLDGLIGNLDRLLESLQGASNSSKDDGGKHVDPAVSQPSVTHTEAKKDESS